jgi:hypothetical protein
MSKLLATGVILCTCYLLMKESSYICVHQGNFLMFYLNVFISILCFSSILMFSNKHKLHHLIGITNILCKMVLTRVVIMLFPVLFVRDIAFLLVCHVGQHIVLDILHLYQLDKLSLFAMFVIPWYMIYNETIINNNTETFYLGNLVGIVVVSAYQYIDPLFDFLCQYSM